MCVRTLRCRAGLQTRSWLFTAMECYQLVVIAMEKCACTVHMPVADGSHHSQEVPGRQTVANIVVANPRLTSTKQAESCIAFVMLAEA